MGTNAPTAENVADLLQNLQVDSQSSIRDTVEVQSNPNAGTQEVGLDPSGAGVADTSNISAGYGGMEAGMYYALNGYPTHHGYYIGGYDYTMGDWDDYSRHASAEGVDPQNPGAYSETGPLVYHPSGYAYNPQHLYASYTSGAAIRGDGQLYSAQGYSYSGQMYQQSLPSNVPFIPSSTPASLEASTGSTGESSSERSASTAVSGNNGPSVARPGYMGYPSGVYGRGILPVSAPISGSQDVRVGYEGARIGAPWSDLSKVAEVQQRHGLSSMSASGQNVRPLAPLLPHIPSGQQHRPRIGVASTAGTLGRAFQPSARIYPGSANSGRIGTATGWEPRGHGRHWYALDKGKPWGRGNVVLSNGGPSWDILNEQNKGPRTTRGRYQRTNSGGLRYIRTQGAANGTPEPVSLPVNKDQYNGPDFVTAYDNAKFFIIKSYSEDDIHKSIKYSVWASTANGNKKLDAAYHEAQASSGVCPLFLFFSVNASGQFCGVAEMVGPVDFNKSLDFWQQDKWTGKVPVKWHIVKDVPNSQFRHIILENNDNKSVTNSRDTQEVPLGQGSEMLNIFKNYNLKTSILDDFQFYETRQKFMQEKRARQLTHLQHPQIIRHVNKEVDEKPTQDDTAQSGSHDAGLGGSVEGADQSKKLVKPSDGQNNVESFKGSVAEDAQTDDATSPQPESQKLSSQERLVESSLSTSKSSEK